MATGTDYPVAVVLINRHEPEGEATARLVELAEEKDYSPSVVEAHRGEHDVSLSWTVPQDVAEAFDAERAERWPADKVENEDGEVAAVDGDAYAADNTRRANDARRANIDNAENDDTHQGRRARPGKAKE